MKQGRSLKDFAGEITAQANAKKDYIVPTGMIVMTDDNKVSFGPGVMPVSDLTHTQIAAHVGIPKPYYDKMRKDAPDLLASNVNRWFTKYPAARMVRTLRGEARAFLSDSYRPLDNVDLAEAVLPVLQDLDVQILSCEITERRLYIKAVDKRIERDIPAGGKMGEGHHIFDTLCPAITIGNSEVGDGAMAVQTSVWTKQCTNMATFAERSVRRTHVGAKHEIAEGLYALLSDETRRVSDHAIWLQVRDVVKAAFDRARFDALVDTVIDTTHQPIRDAVKVVELTAKKFGVTEGERTSILQHLIEGGDLSRYGLFNAVTRTAEDLPDYDRASAFERLGGQIVELPRHEWDELAVAA
jgi:hypothetical protein